MQHAGVLMLVLVVRDAGVVANGQGSFSAFAVVVATAAAVDGGVEGEGVDNTSSEGGVAAAAAAGVALAVSVVGVEGAGGVSDAAGDSIGVEGASGVDNPGGVVRNAVVDAVVVVAVGAVVVDGAVAAAAVVVVGADGGIVAA